MPDNNTPFRYETDKEKIIGEPNDVIRFKTRQNVFNLIKIIVLLAGAYFLGTHYELLKLFFP